MEWLTPLFPEATIKLPEFALQSTYFMYNGEFYEKVGGVAMGLPLSPVIADFFMEAFEKRALDQAPLKPLLYWRCRDNTLLVWSYGQEALNIPILFPGFLSLKRTEQLHVSNCRDARHTPCKERGMPQLHISALLPT